MRLSKTKEDLYKMVSLNRGRASITSARNLKLFQSDVKTSNMITLSKVKNIVNFGNNRNDDSLHLRDHLLSINTHVFYNHKNCSTAIRSLSTSTFDFLANKQELITTHSSSNGQRSIADNRKKHLSNKLNTLKGDLSQRSENEKILNSLLSLNINRRGRAYLDQHLGIFRKIQQNENCTSKDATFLLKFCGNYVTDETPVTRSNLSERLWKYLIDSGVHMDSSHYNKLLKTRLENRMPEFDPFEFLSMMKENRVEPDRVTFQHLIAKYCSTGDIHGARSMLELMKEKRMPITKYVFRSLIIGHCRHDDFDGAKSVIDVMRNSGLDVSSETKMIYIMELARAGKNFRHELQNAIKEGETFNDQDYFKLTVMLLENNNKEDASDIVEMLPIEKGFLQEMRKYIPSLIAAGGLELSYKIYENSLSHQSLENSSTERDCFEDNGQFLLRTSIKHQWDPKELIHYLQKLEGSSPTPDAYSRLLEHCADLESISYGQNVHGEIVKSYGQTIELVPGDGFLVQHMGRLRTQSMLNGDISSSIVQFLIKLGAVGLSTRVYQLSKIIIPNIMEGTDTTPDGFLQMYSNKLIELENSGIQSRAPVPINLVANSMFRYYLSRENSESFENAVQLLFSRKDLMRPHFWNLPLARSFLRTQSQNALITILSLCSSSFKNSKKHDTEDQMIRKDADLFKALHHIAIHSPNFHPDKKPEETLLPVFSELVNLKIGVPGVVIKELRTTLTNSSDELSRLLMQLEGNYLTRRDIWTKEAIKKFLGNRRKIHKNNFGPIKLDGFVPVSKRKINRYTT